MNKLTKSDLEDITLLFEELVKQLPKMKRSERIDVAARLRASGKHIAFILETVKDEVKEVRAGKQGTVNGEQWLARLSLVPVNRLDQGLLKIEQPVIYAKYTKTCIDQRVTFEVR